MSAWFVSLPTTDAGRRVKRLAAWVSLALGSWLVVPHLWASSVGPLGGGRSLPRVDAVVVVGGAGPAKRREAVALLRRGRARRLVLFGTERSWQGLLEQARDLNSVDGHALEHLLVHVPGPDEVEAGLAALDRWARTHRLKDYLVLAERRQLGRTRGLMAGLGMQVAESGPTRSL